MRIRRSIGDKSGISSTVNNIGNLYLSRGDFMNALKYFDEALVIDTELSNQRGISTCLNNIGLIHIQTGNYELAIDYYSGSLKISKELQDANLIANALNNIGHCHVKKSNFEIGLDYYYESLKIFEDRTDKPMTATVLVRIGTAFSEKGEFGRAVEFFSKALSIFEEIHHKRGIASSIHNLGTAFLDQGNYQKALKFFNLSLTAMEGLGEKPGISNSLKNIGTVHAKLNDRKKAAQYYSKSLKIKMEMGQIGKVAAIIGEIGNLFYDDDNIDSSLYYHERSLEMYEELDEKIGIARSLNNIARIYQKVGKYELAREYSVRAKKIAQEIGSRQVSRDASLGLYKSYQADGIYDSVEVHLRKIIELRNWECRNNFAVLAEKEKELYFKTMRSDYDLCFDFSFMQKEKFPKISALCYDNALFMKGLLLKSSTAMSKSILTSGDSVLISKYYDWMSLKRRITKSFAEGTNNSLLEEKAAEIEEDLVRGSKEFSTINEILNLSWKKVQGELREGESAIEYVRFMHQSEDNSGYYDQVMYCALIINNNSQNPEMIQLFEEQELQEIVGTFPGNNLTYIEQVYGSKENTKSELYNLIWKPLEPYLVNTIKIFVSPVGLLHKISFAALAKGQDIYLCDLFDIEMQSSTGNLAHGELAQINQNSAYTLFGGIDYNSDSTSTEIWSYLEGSLSETEKIERTLSKAKRKVDYFNLASATEARFKKIASESNILHIATHGFFYADPDAILDAVVDEEESKVDLVFRGGTSGMGVQMFVKSRNPLMRSGLVFAGANDVWNRSSIEGEDGVLTAAEVATIDMRNCDLVVLSACETGLGDIKGSEGVYGLQRSFKMAGVKYIIMSLWQVPDKETAEFMTTFYKNLIKSDDIKKAFKETQLAMRKKYDPYYWAAFVLVE
ncbi:CHAT domain-containing protein [Crocinitomix catalasitica]|nr:CHAT domain-containing protein [Crocinitomix catalasitica]